MPRTKEKSFCCGAGGARMWMEETLGTRINTNRTEEAIATGAERIAIGCPFCRVMISDGLTAKQSEGEAESVEVVDVAQMLLAAVRRGEPGAEAGHRRRTDDRMPSAPAPEVTAPAAAATAAAGERGRVGGLADPRGSRAAAPPDPWDRAPRARPDPPDRRRRPPAEADPWDEPSRAPHPPLHDDRPWDERRPRASRPPEADPWDEPPRQPGPADEPPPPRPTRRAAAPRRPHARLAWRPAVARDRTVRDEPPVGPAARSTPRAPRRAVDVGRAAPPSRMLATRGRASRPHAKAAPDRTVVADEPAPPSGCQP